jgi:hypothetical protein
VHIFDTLTGKFACLCACFLPIPTVIVIIKVWPGQNAAENHGEVRQKPGVPSRLLSRAGPVQVFVKEFEGSFAVNSVGAGKRDKAALGQFGGIIMVRPVISYSKPGLLESDYNIFFCPGECICRDSVIQGMLGVDTWEKWQEADFDIHSIVSDPLFIDAANHVYFLDANSPAFEVGFKPIDISEVGLRAKRPETY